MNDKKVFALYVKKVLKLMKWKAITLIRGTLVAKQTLQIVKCCVNHVTDGSLESK